MKENIEIAKVNDQYVCKENAYNIYVTGYTAEEAFNKFIYKKEQYLKLVNQYQLETDIELQRNYNEQLLSNSSILAIKKNTITVLFIIIWGAAFGLSFKLAFKYTANQIKNLSSEIIHLSDKQRLQLFKDKIQVLKPYASELKQLFNNTDKDPGSNE